MITLTIFSPTDFQGLRGPLIIYDPEDPQKHLYDVDDESTIFQVGDSWHNSTVPLLAGYVATGIVPVSDSGTVDGAGRFQGGPAVPFAVTNVVKGQRYRLRIINQSARNVFTISIDKHFLTIIEADGVATQPLLVNEIEMLAGQRYSAIVSTPPQLSGSLALELINMAHSFTQTRPLINNAPFVSGDPSRNLNQNATLSRGILRYAGGRREDPRTPMTLGPDPTNPLAFVEANLKPLVNNPPGIPDVNITLNLVVTTGAAQWNVNNVSYLPPVVPTLVKILAGADEPANFNVTENTFLLPVNATIQITFPPMLMTKLTPSTYTEYVTIFLILLHPIDAFPKNNFWVVKSNSSDSDVINTIDPIKRDVTAVGAEGTIVRFTTDNIVMASGTDEVRTDVEPDAAWEGLCPAYDALPSALQ
uniref:Laccase-like protein claX n=1 Tax=Ampulloclitocybe clavipes TaxID=56467 RepID=CLAX_AMPCV